MLFWCIIFSKWNLCYILNVMNLRLTINLPDNSFQVHTGFPNANVPHNILKKSMQVYSKLTLVIKTAFQNFNR
jgi:hypothetical protein